MKSSKKIIGLLLIVAILMSLVLTACHPDDGGTTTTNPGSSSSTTIPTGPSNPTNPSNPDDPTDPTGPSIPTGDLQIVVVPDVMEIYAGEEIDLMFGVVANEGARIIIVDDSDFDNETPGTYVITYQAILDDKTVTGTRTITVLEALSNIALEVRKNNLGENKWQGNLLSFANNLFVTLSGDTELAAQSGVFFNSSDKAIVLSVKGQYGCSAIIDKNGVVIEGRDGANSKLVNAKNPTRVGSSATMMNVGGENVKVSSVFAQQMTIPAGGYAIVVQANYAGTTADTDGRGFMNYNVIYEIGNVVRLFWVDTNETLTPYVNQKPTVSGNTKLLVRVSDPEFDLSAAVLAGLIAKDDNGTFASDDDVTLDNIKIVSNGNFDIAKVGTYTIKLSVSDGKLTTEFTREVEVKSEGVEDFYVGDNKMSVAMDFVVKNKELASVGSYSFIIYTSSYNGTIGFSNGHGEAFIVNKYGEIVRIYDGANAKYYDKANVGGVQNGTCTANNYVNEAFASLQDGETLIIAPHTTVNSAAGGSRAFLHSNRTIGAIVSGLGLTFETKDDEDPCANGHSFVNGVCGNCGAEDPDYDPCAGGHDFVNGICSRCEAEDPDYVVPDDSKTFTIGDKTFISSAWAFNDSAVGKSNAAQYTMIIYGYGYEGTVDVNDYGVAIVIDKYGVLDRVYDAANVGFWTAAGKAASAGFTVSDFDSVAFASLKEGEIMIIFPNDGVNNTTSPRNFALGIRSLCGQTVTLTDFTFETHPCAGGHNFVEGVCTRCEAEDPDYDPCAGGHDFVDGACTRCEEPDPDYVAPEDKLTLTIGSNSYEVDKSAVAVNQALTAVGDYKFIVYTSAFEGELGFTNGYGVAIVVNQYGEIVRIYDGASGKFFDKDNTSGATGAGCTANGYAKEAFDSLQAGETVIIAPNSGDNAHRGFLYSNRTVGAVVSGLGLTFEEKVTTYEFKIGTNSMTVEIANVAVDQALTAVGSYKFIVYTSAFEGELGFTNGYGVAIVVNKYGEIVRIYDGASGKFFDKDNTSGATGAGCTANGYAKEAFDSLQAGETVIIAPNSGDNAHRGFLYSNRTVGAVVSGLGLEFETK